MMKEPLISIIIPVYNVESYLHKCINSVLCQSFQKFELILVDDGSTDNSGKICDEYSQKDRRIKVIHQKMQDNLLQEIMVLKFQKGIIYAS